MVDRETSFREHDQFWRNAPPLYFTVHIWQGFKERMEWMVKNSKGDVLDCGCNDGTFIERVRLAGHRTVGIDFLPLNIQRAKETWPEGTFMVMDVEDLKFTDESFDTVCLTETIEHLVDPRKGLKEIHRVLRKGGRLLLTTTYIKGEPTHYHDYQDSKVVLDLVSESFTIESASLDKEHCLFVIGMKREL
jgi:ubiquinone/menaquinone biosynthesis C-methylase UbiE